MGTASALLTAGLGFSIRSGQNTAGLPLLRATQTAAPGLWVSADLFRQRGWRMMGSSWGVRVFLLSPRDGIAGVFLLVLFLMVPVVLLLPWAPSGRRPELLLCGGLVCGFYLEAQKLPALLMALCWAPLLPRVLPIPF